jgi:outer membrane receptor protein involved in Fe transport
VSREVRAALLAGAGGLTAFVFASAALAQAAAPAAPAAEPEAEVATGQEIVVTGSRIARKDYESTSPIVTVGDQLLKQSSTAAIEANLNRLPQFTPAKTPQGGGDIQPTAINTPGAATVSLRGLGANRNLVLLDGRRATPSNAAGIVDINTIPSAAVERVEIISGGASATYGADAVAGVTNFILKKNFKGFEIDGQANLTQEGDGLEWQISGIIGTDFAENRGNISMSMSMNTRETAYQRKRDWYQDLWANPNIATNRFFNLYPGIALGSGNAPSNSVFYNTLFPGTTNLGVNGFTSPQRTPPTDGQPLANTIFGGNGGALGPNGFSVFVNPNGSLFTTGYNQRGGVQFFNAPALQGDLIYKRANGALNFVDTTAFAVLPLTRYNMFARGNYEINDWLTVFGQGLYSSTKTTTTQQGGSITSGWDVFVPYGTGVYTGSANPSTAYGTVGNPSSVILNGMTGYGGTAYAGGQNVNGSFVDSTPGDLTDNPTNPTFRTAYGAQFACANNATGGCSNNQIVGQFLPQSIQTLLNSRPNPNGRVELNYAFPENRTVTNKVSTFNIIAGFQGKIPGTDWSWEAFGNHGTTTTFTRQTGVFSLTRLRTLLNAPAFGKGIVANSNTASGRPAFGANFAGCTSGMNFFTLAWSQISQDCKNAVTSDLKNNQEITQSIGEIDASGTLFALPAGDLKAAIGTSYRRLKYQFVNDTITGQGQSFLDQAVGIYPSSDSFGSYDVKEFYGELLVPVLKDIPGIRSLNLELGGRISDYNTTGNSYTYKILADWEVTSWLRARGGYNRAERAPNIAELFQSSSQVFGSSALGDLCSQQSTYRISANPTAGGANAANVQAVCSAVMDRTGGAGTGAAYYARPVGNQPLPGSVFAWTNVTGNPNLKPEVADTWTAGIVVSSPFTSPALRRLRFTADWYSIKLKKAIGQQSAGTALQQCLDPAWNPAAATAASSAAAAQTAAASVYCRGIRYDPAPILAAANFDVSYFNNGKVDIQGIDAQLDWAVDVGPGTFNLNALLNYYLHYKSTELSTNPIVDYVGTLGTAQNGLNAGAFRYRTLTTFGYTYGPASISLQWQHLPSIKQEGAALAPTAFTGYPSYDLFNLSGNISVTRDLRIRLGVDNLMNKRPPIGNVNTAANLALGQLPGGAFNTQFYDIVGRRFFLGVNAKF